MEADEDSTRPTSPTTAAAGEPTSNFSNTQKWKLISNECEFRPGPRSGAASAVYENSLYIFGGYGGNGRLDDLYEYTFDESRWRKVTTRGTPPAGRENNGALIYKGAMYIFGGYSGFYWLNDFHRLDLQTFEWSLVIPREGNPPSTRFGYVSAVWKDSMFIFGGYDGATWLNDLHEYEFMSQKWSRVEAEGSIPSVRSCPSWACYKESVFVFGGYDGVHRLNDFHEFNAEKKLWTQVVCTGPSPSPRYFHASVVYGDSLFIFGGYSGTERLQDLYQFKFEKHGWTKIEVENAPSGRSSLAAQVHGHSMYIFGGYNGSLVLNDFHEFQFEPVAIPRSTFIDDLRNMINNPALSDVTFIVEDREIHACKAFLAARSEYFRAMLFGGMRDHTQKRIVLHDIDYQIFIIIIEFLYTDQVEDISLDLAVPLLIASELYMLERLKAICQDIIRKEINHDNVVQILIAAHHHRAFSLKEICLDYIITQGKSVRTSPSFKNLMSEPELMMEILLRIK